MPFRRLFRSRWVALLWAGGVVWFACDTAGSAPATNDPVTDAADLDTVAALVANAS